MTTYIANAFALSMLPTYTTNVEVREVNALPTEGYVSIIGHDSLIPILEGITGHTYPVKRISVKLTDTDTLYVAQYTGPRLPEGATELPEGASLVFLRVRVIPQDFFVAYDIEGENVLGGGTTPEYARGYATDYNGAGDGVQTIRCTEELYRAWVDGIDTEGWDIDPETGIAYI